MGKPPSKEGASKRIGEFTVITWEAIDSECQGFREGFVSVFRKYEGQETDETDAYGRPVKVTMASFARHMGIAKQTFADWCNPPDLSTDTVPISPETKTPPAIKGHLLDIDKLNKKVIDDRVNRLKFLYVSLRGNVQRLHRLNRENDYEFEELEYDLAKAMKEVGNELPVSVLEQLQKGN